MKVRVYWRQWETGGGGRPRTWAALLLAAGLLCGALTGCSGTRLRDAESSLVEENAPQEEEKDSTSQEAENDNKDESGLTGDGKSPEEVPPLDRDLAAAADKIGALLSAKQVQENDRAIISEAAAALNTALHPQPTEGEESPAPDLADVQSKLANLQTAWQMESLNRAAAAMAKLADTLRGDAPDWSTAQAQCAELMEAWRQYTALSSPSGITQEEAAAAEQSLKDFQAQIQALQTEYAELEGSVKELRRLDELETSVAELKKSGTSLPVLAISLLTLIGVAVLVFFGPGTGSRGRGGKDRAGVQGQQPDAYAEKMDRWIKELEKVRDASEEQRLEVSNFLGRIEKMERQIKELRSQPSASPSAVSAANAVPAVNAVLAANVGNLNNAKGNQGTLSSYSPGARTNLQKQDKIFRFNFDTGRSNRKGEVYLRETYGIGVFSGVESQGSFLIWPDVWGMKHTPRAYEELGKTNKMKLYNGNEAIKMCFDVDPEYPTKDEVFRITLLRFASVVRSEGGFKLEQKGSVKATGMGD